MADALLGIVIQNLVSFAQEELATYFGVGELTQILSRKLTLIRGVLNDAEKKQITNDAVKEWLQQLRDAAYVLDDILDECSITSKANGDNITRFHPMKILARRNIGKRMNEIAKKIDGIAEERMKFGLVEGVVEHQPEDEEWRQTISVMTESKIYGRDKDKEQILKFLLRHASNSEELSVYSIFGLGGYGKTTLAQMVFNDERVETHFDPKIWVCVSVDFNMMNILKSIIESIIGKNPDLSSLESMQKKVQEILQNIRYLLVLDDVWNEDQEKWDKLKAVLKHRMKGASVLVTTRHDKVASIMGTYPAHHLVNLSDDDIWSLFKQQAFGENREERAELVAIGKKLARKCVGSPLAAKILGSSLCSKSKERQWLSVLESEFWNLAEDDPIMSIMSALRLSYFNLKSYLRPCFTFCAVFPKGFEMVKENLIHLWMANGLVTSRGNLQMEMEHVGDDVWNQLWKRSFFQEVKSDFLGNITFKMHDLVHDLAKSVIGEECISYDVSNLNNLSVRVHHLSLFDKKSKYDYMIPFQKVDSLRTFLEYKPPSKNLDVLLSNTSLRAFCSSSSQLLALKSLIHLRFLELSRSKITTLPDSICRLLKLQTLKLQDCDYLSSFPKQLTKLQDLRHLLIQNCPSLISTPFRIGELTCLKTLTIFIVGSKTGYGLSELHNLQLGGKLYIKDLQNVSNVEDAREANLIGKTDLNRLYLSWGDYAREAKPVLEALEPYSGLTHFAVNRYGGTDFPRWMRNTSILKALVSIILYNCRNCRQLPPFGKLPCLTNLYVSGIKDLKYIDDDLYEPVTEKAFTSLKKLTLLYLPNLVRVLEVEGVEMLTQLSKLRIVNVPKLALPSLPSVASLSAHDGNEELLKSVVYESNMYNLKSLSISFIARLKELPVELGTLSALESLEITRCDEMESFSEHLLKGLSSLRTLSFFGCNRFKSLSDGMRHLTCLESLVIHSCPQFVFPDNTNSLTSLRKLDVWNGNEHVLDSLGTSFSNIPSLQSLSLVGFASLTSLPDWLGAMTSLQVLQIIGFPKLSSLPDNFQDLRNLKTLDIHRCPMLRSLPENFQQLQNLQKLWIGNCPILEKRCKRGIGEDRHKISHIPQFVLNGRLQSDAEPTKPTICGN